MIVAVDCGQRKYWQSTHKHCRLTQILSSDSTLYRIVHDQKSKSSTAQGPRQAQVRLQKYSRVAQTFLLGLVGQIEDRRVDTERTNARRHEQNPYRLTAQRAKIEKRWSIIDFVLVFDFTLLILQVEDGPPLGVVQGGGPIECAQDEGQEDDAGDCL